MDWEYASVRGPRMRGSRMRTTLKLAVPLGVFAVAVTVFSALNHTTSPRAGDARPAQSLAAGVRPGRTSTDQSVAALQAQIRGGARPAPFAALGSAYLQKVRETGDASYYARAEGVLRLALRRDSRDVEAVIGMGTLALARHDFRGGLVWGRRARALVPEAAGPFPIVVDALVELGRYDEAGRALQELLDRKPGLPAYARASYFRELHGDLRGAVDAMRLAVAAGSSTPEGTAYVQTLLGTLAFIRGRVTDARAAYRAALSAQPAYPAAQAGLARTEAAGGHLGRAIQILRRVVERLPQPEYVVALGETELAAGRTRQARDDLALMPVERRLLAVRGVNTDVVFALFEADHGNPRAGVRLARRAWSLAPGVRSADAVGWTLTRAGRPAEGFAWARRALRLGWREPLTVYHAGMSARAAGRRLTARRLLGGLLAQVPRFSPLYAPRARRALEGLR